MKVSTCLASEGRGPSVHLISTRMTSSGVRRIASNDEGPYCVLTRVGVGSQRGVVEVANDQNKVSPDFFGTRLTSVSFGPEKVPSPAESKRTARHDKSPCTFVSFLCFPIYGVGCPRVPVGVTLPFCVGPGPTPGPLFCACDTLSVSESFTTLESCLLSLSWSACW